MSEYYDKVNDFRNQILDIDSGVANSLIRSYTDSYRRISIALMDLTKQISEMSSRGVQISRGRLYEQTRLIVLLGQIRDEIDRFSQLADVEIVNGARAAILAAETHAEHMIGFSLRQSGGFSSEDVLPFTPKFNRLAVEQLVSKFSRGAISDLLTGLGPEAVKIVQDTFVAGLIQGQAPVKLAKQLREHLDIPLKRAMTISRTEVMSAYRAASIENYRTNTTTVKGWKWVASLSGRTCAMCLAMDGREFSLRVEFGSHPNCRCVCVPITRSWEELGFEGIPNRKPSRVSGQEWFSAQPTDTQRRVLGKEKLDMFRSGELTLDDLIGYRNDSKWGPTRFERSLIDISKGRYRNREAA